MKKIWLVIACIAFAGIAIGLTGFGENQTPLSAQEETPKSDAAAVTPKPAPEAEAPKAAATPAAEAPKAEAATETPKADAKTDAAPGTDHVAAVKKAVTDYWQTRMKGLLEKLYQMEEPAFREKTTLKDYYRRFGNMSELQDVKITDVELKDEAKTALVTLMVAYKLNIPVPGVQGKVRERKMSDNWIRVGETWYHQTPASSPMPSQPPALPPSPPAS